MTCVGHLFGHIAHMSINMYIYLNKIATRRLDMFLKMLLNLCRKHSFKGAFWMNEQVQSSHIIEEPWKLNKTCCVVYFTSSHNITELLMGFNRNGTTSVISDSKELPIYEMICGYLWISLVFWWDYDHTQNVKINIQNSIEIGRHVKLIECPPFEIVWMKKKCEGFSHSKSRFR